VVSILSEDITLNSDILVIDDSTVVLAVVKSILESRYNVRIAQSAKDAYDDLKKKLPDLILLDLEMPEVNGFEFLQTIISNPEWKDIPVIFLTGISDRKKEEQALELGAVEYILKPIAEGILLKRVHFHLELRMFQKRMEELVEQRTEELLKTQGELQEAVANAEEALRVKSKFLANMSHEIRTPMNSIMGFSEIALDNDISQETREYILKIKDSTILLLRVINDILDISKIEAGKLEIERISFCPGGVISNCQTMITQFIENKKLEFVVRVDEELNEKQLLGDPVRLYQALLNLLSNAGKFTPRGTITLSAELLTSDATFATIRFTVEDTGIGMTPEQIESVFEPFSQVDSETTRAHDGTGLGLSITKNIVELMSGTLTVESKLGTGSKFSIEIKFPVTNVAGVYNDAFSDSIPDHIEKPQFQGEVLVCEDNEMNQQVIQEHLKRVGLDTVIVENGLDGLKKVMKRIKKKEKLFDLILMDMQMPVMDGFEATARINALGTGIPIVALTANVMATDLEEYKRNGLMDCIGKPFQTWDLWRCLLSFLMPVSKTVISANTLNRSDKELMKKLQSRFTGDNKKRVEKILRAIEINDLKQARILAHTLKSNAGLIGEEKLQELAAHAEKLIEKENLQDIVLVIKNLTAELDKVFNKLEEMRKQNAFEPEENDDFDESIEDIPIESKKGILIVDDEKSNIIALTHFLKDDYSVFVTRDSRDTQEMAEDYKPDIILLDILMPEMDGYEVITALKRSDKTKDIPVLFISGLTSKEAMDKGLSLGAVDYIKKPFKSSIVKEKIRKILKEN